MDKLTPHNIAIALMQATMGKNDTDMRHITQRLIALLTTRKRLHLLPAIIATFERMHEKSFDVRLTLASDAEGTRLTGVIDEACNLLDITRTSVVRTANAPSLISGFVLESAHARVDFSGKSQLIALHRHLIS